MQTIGGKRAKVESPDPTPLTFSEQFLDLGMPKSEMPTERGDLVVSVNIEYPISLPRDEKRVLRNVLPRWLWTSQDRWTGLRTAL